MACEDKMKRVFFHFVLVLLSVFVIGCSYEVKSPQYSIAVYPKDLSEATLLRDGVKSFALHEGFTKESAAGIENHLEENGRFLISFTTRDDSFISLSNVANVNCYTVAVFSSANPDAAPVLGQKLVKALQNKIGNLVVEQTDGCQ